MNYSTALRPCRELEKKRMIVRELNTLRVINNQTAEFSDAGRVERKRLEGGCVTQASSLASISSFRVIHSCSMAKRCCKLQAKCGQSLCISDRMPVQMRLVQIKHRRCKDFAGTVAPSSMAARTRGHLLRNRADCWTAAANEVSSSNKHNRC